MVSFSARGPTDPQWLVVGNLAAPGFAAGLIQLTQPSNCWTHSCCYVYSVSIHKFTNFPIFLSLLSVLAAAAVKVTTFGVPNLNTAQLREILTRLATTGNLRRLLISRIGSMRYITSLPPETVARALMKLETTVDNLRCARLSAEQAAQLLTKIRDTEDLLLQNSLLPSSPC